MTYGCRTEGLLASRRLAWGLAGACGGVVSLAWYEVASEPAAAWLGGLLLAAGAFGLWLAVATRYAITDFDLVIRYGPLAFRIPLECIEGVVPSTRRVIGPRREVAVLSVAWRRGRRARMAHVTPEAPERFLDELAASAPFLQRQGDRLVRTPGLAVPA